MGNELRYIRITARDIVKSLTTGDLPIIGKPIDWIRAMKEGYNVDTVVAQAFKTHIVMPTPIGIPLIVKSINAHAISMVGRIKINGEIENLGGGEAAAIIDIKPSIAHESTITLGYDLPLIHTGTAIKAHVKAVIPAHIEVICKPIEKEVAIKWMLPQENIIDILKVKIFPATFIHKLPAVFYADPAGMEMKEVVSPVVKPISIKLPVPIPSVGIVVENIIETPHALAAWAPIIPLSGKFVYIARVKQTTTANKHIVAKIKWFMGEPESSIYEGRRQWPAFRSGESYRSAERIEGWHEGKIMGKFEPVVPDPMIEPIAKYPILISFEAREVPTPWQILSQWTILRGRHLMYQINVQMIESLTGWKILADTVLDAMKVMDIVMMKVPEKALVMKAKIGVGKGSFGESEVGIKVIAGRKVDKVVVPVEPWTINVIRYYLGLKDIEISDINQTPVRPYAEGYEARNTGWGWSWPWSSEPIRARETYPITRHESARVGRVVIPIEAPLPTVYTVKAEIEQRGLPEKCLASLHGALNWWVQTCLKRYATVRPIGAGMPANKVIIAAHCIPEWQKLNVVAKIPALDEEIIADIPFPKYLPHSKIPKMAHSRWIERAGHGLIWSDIPAVTHLLTTNKVQDTAVANKFSKEECMLVEDPKAKEVAIKTFDGVTMKGIEVIPECETILAMDTSPSKILTVITSKKALKVLLPMTKVHSSLSGRLTGLCGNFDGEAWDELSGPGKKVHEKPEAFIISWLVPSAKCNIEELRKKYGVVKAGMNICEVKERNVMRRRTEYGEPQICLSVKPVPVCSPGCIAEGVETDYMGFHCLPANNFATRCMVEQSEIRPLQELAERYPDTFENVEIHRRCVPAY